MKKENIVIGVVAVVIVVGLVFSIVAKVNSNNKKNQLLFGIFDRAFEMFDKASEQMEESYERQKQSDEEFENSYNDATEKIDEVDDAIEQRRNEMEITTFNNGLEMYAGTKVGFHVKSLLDKVVTSNKENADHIVTVVYNEIITADTTTITNMKQSLDDMSEYDVSFDYDTNGFINKVTIKA